MADFIFSFPFAVSISPPLVYFTAFSFLRRRAAQAYFALWAAAQVGQRAVAEPLADGWPDRVGSSRADRSGFRFY
jgi:hypothetical protein